MWISVNSECYCQVKTWAKDLNRHLTKEDMQMSNEYMKRCSTSHVIREMPIKILMMTHCTSIKMAKRQNPDASECCWGWAVTRTHIDFWWEYKMAQPLWKIFWQPFTKLTIWLVIKLLGICPNKLRNYVYTKTYMWMFIEVLLITGKTWKEPKCLPVDT